MTIPIANRFTNLRRPAPVFFDDVRGRASKRWDQLESDPELAGPWKQLFAQVQSPRHVLSELLQNADDAGAKHARASIIEGQFIFEHDGEDFNEDQFASLCRFGFSNKRKLHTIGFRGIGFKSTFSLGNTVEVLTPSLAIEFKKQRFTEPVWIESGPSLEVTRIAVKIQDPNRETELKKNLKEWVSSPASLLFFNSICELTIGDVTLRKDILGPGPVTGSQKIGLTGCGEHNLIFFSSVEEPFPEDVFREIQQERDIQDLHLPPCRVELVLGLPGEQRLYVVLPTRVKVGLPFSCNAPFLQDPARSAIKNPSTSPTNRWLLDRLGRLAGDSLCTWLRNDSLPLDVRAEAYSLVPERVEGGDSIEADSANAIWQEFVDATAKAALLLTTEGLLVEKNECIAPPKKTYSVWSPTDLLKLFGYEKKHVLSEKISEQARKRLQSWGRLALLDADRVLTQLASGRPAPRPQNYDSLLHLWCFIQEVVRYDFSGKQRCRLSLVPIQGQDGLFPANDVVRLSTKKETIAEDSWDFLTNLVLIIDRLWVEYLAKYPDRKTDIETGQQLLRELNLDRPSDVNEVVGNACRQLFSQSNVGLSECVRMAHIMAGLGARSPAEFLCVTRDGSRHRPSDGIIAAFDSNLEELFPIDWCESHFLHPDYFIDFNGCTKRDWQNWVSSPKSGFMPFAILKNKETRYWEQHQVENLLDSCQVKKPTSYPYIRGYFKLYDFDFEDSLIEHWQKLELTDTAVWAQVADRVINAPLWFWKEYTYGNLKQVGRTNEKEVSCGPIPSAWVKRFSSVRCLPDTQGTICTPAELYLRTPETEPLLGVEPFVRAELDTETTKPLLLLIGVRKTSAGIDKLINRIRDLSGASNPLPLLHEIIKYYGALDRVLARCDLNGIEEARDIFRREPLILTNTGEWAASAEVFQHAREDELPDAPLVHPSVQDLPMWSRLGVADRPSIELVLDWLNSLETGKGIDPPVVRRVRSALQRYPVQVWENCRHWLSLDNTWTPVDQFRFRLTKPGLNKWGDLFPNTKSRAANLQMLSAEVCRRQPFSSLPELAASIEYRLTNAPQELGNPINKSWIAALSRVLQLIKLTDETQMQQVREVANRLGRSVWQPFKTISVTPYIDGTPAGQPHSPEVLWLNDTIFVREGRLAKSFEALVSELSRPFAIDSVKEAMKACIERDSDFIKEYLQEHFDLEDEIVQITTAVAPESLPIEKRVDEDGNGMTTEPQLDIIMDDPKPIQSQEFFEVDELEEKATLNFQPDEEKITLLPRKPPQASLFHLYAQDLGYHWDDARKRFVHSDGAWIERCESPFHWRRFDQGGNVMASYWVARQRLVQGVEISAELWELIGIYPKECYILLMDETDSPIELSGKDLLLMVEDKRISLYPAKYRIRMDFKA